MEVIIQTLTDSKACGPLFAIFIYYNYNFLMVNSSITIVKATGYGLDDRDVGVQFQ
jgi:hypothetical protein